MGRPAGKGKSVEAGGAPATKKATKRANGQANKTGTVVAAKRRKVAVAAVRRSIKLQQKKKPRVSIPKKLNAQNGVSGKVKQEGTASRAGRPRNKKVNAKKTVNQVATTNGNGTTNGNDHAPVAGTSKQLQLQVAKSARAPAVAGSSKRFRLKIAQSVVRAPIAGTSAAAGSSSGSQHPKFLSFRVTVPRHALLKALIAPIRIRIEPCPEIEEKLREAQSRSAGGRAKTGRKPKKSTGNRKTVKAARATAGISNGTGGKGKGRKK